MKLFEEVVQRKPISPHPPLLPTAVLQIKWDPAVRFCHTAARTALKEKAYVPKAAQFMDMHIYYILLYI